MVTRQDCERLYETLCDYPEMANASALADALVEADAGRRIRLAARRYAHVMRTTGRTPGHPLFGQRRSSLAWLRWLANARGW